MTENCRICGKTTKDTNARNIFLSENKIFIVHIELLTGECLQYKPNFPAYICICCEMDLKVAAVFRERCIRMQNKLYQQNLRESKSPELYQIQNDMHFQKDEDVAEMNHSQQDDGISYGDNDDEDDDVDDNDDVHDNDDVDDEEIRLDNLIDENIICDEEYEDYSLLQLQQDNTIKSEMKSANTMKRTLPTPTPTPTQPPPVPVMKNDSNGIPPILPKRYRSWKNIDPEEARRIKSKLRRRDCICDQCGIVIKDISNFKLHQLRHTGIKNYECDVCHGRYYTAHLLKRHKMGHSSVRMYPCQYCDKSFKYSGSRVAHERIHRNERPFKCDVCNKAFRRREALKEHKFKHTFKPSFYCEICDKYFRHSRSLGNHRKSKSHIEQVQGEIDELIFDEN